MPLLRHPLYCPREGAFFFKELLFGNNNYFLHTNIRYVTVRE